MTRACKGSSRASVVMSQLQQGLGGNNFEVNGENIKWRSDFLLTRCFWSGILEYSGFAGVKSQGYTISSSNASLTILSIVEWIKITVTQSTGSTYEFTQIFFFLIEKLENLNDIHSFKVPRDC